jgi:cytochrome P450
VTGSTFHDRRRRRTAGPAGSKRYLSSLSIRASPARTRRARTDLTLSHPHPSIPNAHKKQKQLLIYGLHPVQRYRLRHIPTAPGCWPLLGHLPAYRNPGQVAAWDAWRAAHGRIYKIFLGSAATVVVSDPAAARAVNLRNHQRHPVLVSVTASPATALTANGLFAAGSTDRDFHRELKNAWLPFFTSASLDAAAADMADGAARLGDNLADVARAGGTVDFWREVGKMSLAVVARTAFGIELDAQDDDAPSSAEAAALLAAARTVFATGRTSSAWAVLYQAAPWAAPVIRFCTRFAPGRALARLDAARELIMAKGMALIEADRAAAENGDGDGEEKTGVKTSSSSTLAPPAKGSFLSLFARRARHAAAKGDAGAAAALADPKVIVSNVWTVLLAGYETSATAAAACVHFLSTHPAAADALFEEVVRVLGDEKSSRTPLTADLAAMPYMDAVFKESLRLMPPAPMTLRVAGEDQIIAGAFVPKGTWLQVDTRAIQTDPAIWGADAAEFKPERWLGVDARTVTLGFNAFGAGTLSCVGARFAEVEVKLMLASLVRRFVFEPAGPEWLAGKKTLELVTRLTMGPRHGVIVRPVLRGEKECGGGAPPTPVGVLEAARPASLDGGSSEDDFEHRRVAGKATEGVGGDGLRARARVVI